MPESHARASLSPVREFHEAFSLPAPSYPVRPSSATVRLRLRLIREEFEEVHYELATLARELDRDREFPVAPLLERFRLLLKELCDLRYVTEGTAVALGLDIETAYLEVHRSNMSKLGADGRPVVREDGKVLKGPNYTAADMELAVPEITEGSVEDG